MPNHQNDLRIPNRKTQAFILEPILTPSGLVDAFGEDTLELDTDILFNTDEIFPEMPDDLITNHQFNVDDLLILPFATESEYTAGVFTVGESGEVGIDFLFDGGKYNEGEIGIFSLEGLEAEPGSDEFIQEAARRSLSGTEEGYVIITDAQDGARFSGRPSWEGDFNSGEYQGVQTFQMKAGDRFGIMLSPNDSIESIFDGTADKQPLFSLVTANPDDYLQFGQIADVTGDGNTFAFEDLTLSGKSDKDYNDIVFQIRGATTESSPLMDDLVTDGRDWRQDDIGQALTEYAKAYVPEVSEDNLDDALAGRSQQEIYERDEYKGWIEDFAGSEVVTNGAINDENNWAELLTEKVDVIKELQDLQSVITLDLDLNQLSESDFAAIAYAQEQGVILVVPAGDTPEDISTLGQLSTEFDNIITVGAAEKVNDELSVWKSYDATDSSGQGIELDLVVDVDSLDTTGSETGAAATKLAIAAKKVWLENPELNYAQVIDILQRTATDLNAPNWDAGTGYGMLNLAAAIHLARATQPKPYTGELSDLDLLDRIASFKPDSKDFPGVPNHPTGIPVIPVTNADQGGNSFDDATLLRPSTTQDIIDQVSTSDSTDMFRVESRHLDNSGFNVLTGEVLVTYFTADGQFLGTQTLSRGEHKLALPNGSTEETIVRITPRSATPATYILEGFDSLKSEPFNIELEFDETVSASQRAVMQAAADSVSRFIDQGLPSAIVDGEIIDDIKIKISTNGLDGIGGTQARTKLDFMRYGTLLPAQSLVEFDAADINDLEQSGQLFSATQHEFMHALGFGNLWEAKGLINYAGTPLAQYNGESAVEEFKKLGGLTDTISLENEGSGSAGLHWNEGLFENELMTADANFSDAEGGNAPVSTVTLASLADLGYEINLDAADENYELNAGSSFEVGEGITEEQIAELAAFFAEAEALIEAEKDPDAVYIEAILPEVDPVTVAPEIWADATKFWKNGEFYDWQWYTIPSGDTLSAIAFRTMGSVHPDYYNWIAAYNGIPNADWIVAGDRIQIPVWRPNYEAEQEAERLRREQELREQQEREQREREAELERIRREEQERLEAEEEQRRIEAERRQRELEEQERRLREEQERRRREEERRQEEARLREIERQRGVGGEDWYMATKMPEWSNQDPFETALTGETVGNYVPDDYYRFNLSRNGRVTAELRDLLADADLILYDVRNKPIAYSMREGITDEQIIADLIPGTYMLRVNSPEGVTTDYDLMVRFQHKLSATQSGPPPGWRVGGGSSGGRGSSGPVFADPRINKIYTTALNQFKAAETAKANQKIAVLNAEKRQYERDLEAELAKMNAAQRAKVLAALDGGRHDANVWVDNIVNPIRNTVDSLANGINSKADSLADSLIRGINNVKDFGIGWVKDRKSDARGLVRRGRDAIKSAVNNARSWLKGEIGKIQDSIKSAIWRFFETLKNGYRTGAEINQLIANAANTFRNAFDSAVRDANELVGKFKGRVLGALNWTKDLGINIDRFGVKYKFNAYDKIVKPAVDAISGGVSGMINGIGNSLKGIVNWIEPRTQKAVAAAVNAIFGDKTGQLWNKINNVDQKIADTSSALERAIVAKANELKNQMQSFLNTLGTEGKKVLDTVLNFSNSPAGQISLAVLEVLLGLIPGVGQTLDIKDTGVSLYNIFVQGKKDIWEFIGLIGSLAGWVPLVGDAIKSAAKFARKGVDALASFLKNLGPTVTKNIIGTIGKTNWGTLLKTTVKNIQDKWQSFNRALDGGASWIIDAMGLKPALATANNTMLSFSTKTDDIANELTPVQKRFKEVVEEAGQNITSKLEKLTKFSFPTSSKNHILQGDFVNGKLKSGMHTNFAVDQYVQNNGYTLVSDVTNPATGVRKVEFPRNAMSDSGRARTKTLFPASWSNQQISDVVGHVAEKATTTSTGNPIPQSGFARIQGVYDGITIEVLLDNGNIVSGYPLF